MNSYWLRKLVRDNSVEIMQKDGAQVTYKKLEGDELIAALNAKVLEEADELTTAQDRKEIIGELCDMLELIDLYKKELNISDETLEKAKADKRERRGGFNDQIYVDYIDVPEGSRFDEYCGSEPEKYPPKVA